MDPHQPVPRLLPALFLALLLGSPAAALDLELLFPARTLEVGWSAGFRAEAFTGDYPYRVRAGADQLALYTGIPLYFPAVVSLGSVSQLGYKDDYTVSTPLALLTVGYQSDLGVLASQPGPFLLWGARWQGLSGGVGWEPLLARISAAGGWFGPGGSLSATALAGYGDPGEVPRLVSGTLKARWAFGEGWSVFAGAGWDANGRLTWSAGLGTYLFEPPANSLVDRPWDHLVAHRGSLLRAPENTGPAVELALKEKEIEGIELDVQRTKDGDYLFVHDDFLFRYNGTFERVANLTGRDLGNRDFGRWFSRAFTGTRPMSLSDLGPLALKHPERRWIFDLKNVGTTEADAQAFLDAVALVLPEGRVLVSTGDLRLMPALVDLSPYPVGLQVDVARTFFLWGDYFPPLLSWELESMVRQTGVTSFFLFSSKFANEDGVKAAARRTGVEFYVWNFHDRIWGLEPAP